MIKNKWNLFLQLINPNNNDIRIIKLEIIILLSCP